jgi:DNA polymerase III epsilon subunit-like protein
MIDVSNFLSLDIETTGLDPKKDSIWSIGTSGKSKGEWFLRDQAKFPTMDAMKKAVLNEWGAETYKGVDWPELYKGTGQSTRSAVKEALSAIDRHTVVLIQNTNFENRFFNEALTGLPEKEAAALRDVMRYGSYKEGGSFSNQIFHTPPEVTAARRAANKAFNAYSGKTRDFEPVRAAYAGMMATYDRLIGETRSKGAGAITVDLMDITRATYAEAASKGFLNRQKINIGTNVEFIAHALGFEKEAHRAYKDAALQEEIYKELRNIYGKLRDGSIGTEEKNKLARINAGQYYEGSRQFLASVKNRFQEIAGETGFTKIELDLFTDEDNFTVFDKYTNKKTEIEYYKTNKITQFNNPEFTTSDKKAVIRDLLRQYKKIGGMPGIDIDTIEEQIINDKIKIGDKTHSLDSAIREFRAKAFQDADSDLANRQAKTSTALANTEDWLHKAQNQISKIKAKHVMIGGGLLAGAGLVGMATAGSDENTKKLHARQNEIEYKDTLDYQLKTFKKPATYHGSGFANWKERKGHHQY